jgi:hypothetical protein
VPWGGPPPIAAAADRPPTVYGGVGLQAAVILINGLSLVLALARRAEFSALLSSAVVFAVNAGVTGLLLYKVLARKDWARMILLNLTVLGLFFSLPVLLSKTAGGAAKAGAVLLLGLQVAGVVFLYLPPSNRWYNADT